jgi:hypothetical protein
MDPLHATTEEFAAGILTEIRYALRAPHRQQHRQAARAKAIGARSELRALSSGAIFMTYYAEQSCTAPPGKVRASKRCPCQKHTFTANPGGLLCFTAITFPPRPMEAALISGPATIARVSGWIANI